MNFIQTYKNQFVRLLLALFILSSVVLPALAPAITFAASGQSLDEAAAGGLDDSQYKPDVECSLDAKGIPQCLALISYYILKFTYWAAGWFGIFFNFTLNELIFGMGTLVSEMEGIMFAWKTIRDITNVFLVFLTIYIGIATILGISGFGAKQMLWKVVLAALLVNFSVTFTKVVIDISNITAIQTFLMFQTKTITEESDCSKRVSETGKVDGGLDKNVCITNGIASAFWDKLRITTIFNFAELREKAKTEKGEIASTLYMNMTYTFLMASVMFTVLAFVFGAAGLLFVARFVILVFLLIVSPIALVLWITGVSSQGRAWWHALINQSIFPAAILLCWWIAYQILDSYTSKFDKAQLSTIGEVTPSATSIVTMFIIVIGFLIAGLIMASKLGAHGADAMLKTGKNWSRAAAGGLAVGGGIVAAHTLGRASAAAQRKYADQMAQDREKDEATGEFKNTSLRARAYRSMAGGKIDRGVSAIAGAGANMKFGTRSTFAERDSANTKARSERNKEINTVGRQESVRRAMETLNNGDERVIARHGETGASPEYKEAQKTIANASQVDIEHLRATQGSRANTQEVRESLSKKQATALAARDDVTPEHKRQLTERAFKDERAAIRNVGTTTDPAAKDAHIKTLRNMSSSDIKENASILKDQPSATAHMSHQTFKQLKENKDEVFDAPTIAQFVKARETHFDSLTDDALKKEIRETKPADLAEHTASFLGRAEVVENIDPQTLAGMVRIGLSQEKREAMKASVEAAYKKIPAQSSEPSSILDSKGKPIEKAPVVLTPAQQNIVKLRDWLNDENKMKV